MPEDFTVISKECFLNAPENVQSYFIYQALASVVIISNLGTLEDFETAFETLE